MKGDPTLPDQPVLCGEQNNARVAVIGFRKDRPRNKRDERNNRALQDEFDRAGLNADAETLERLLADDFLSIGPRGFTLDKREWIERHTHFTC